MRKSTYGCYELSLYIFCFFYLNLFYIGKLQLFKFYLFIYFWVYWQYFQCMAFCFFVFISESFSKNCGMFITTKVSRYPDQYLYLFWINLNPGLSTWTNLIHRYILFSLQTLKFFISQHGKEIRVFTPKNLDFKLF